MKMTEIEALLQRAQKAQVECTRLQLEYEREVTQIVTTVNKLAKAYPKLQIERIDESAVSTTVRRRKLLKMLEAAESKLNQWHATTMRKARAAAEELEEMLDHE